MVSAFSFSAALLASMLSAPAWGQGKSKPARAKPPVWDESKFEGVFFSDLSKALVGKRPSPSDVVKQPASTSSSPTTKAVPKASQSDGWNSVVSSTSLEGLIKDAKGRLAATVVTPSAFRSGGNFEASRELSLLALLFAILEDYPGDVRWKSSARAARSAMSRAAQSPTFEEAKKRVQDLDVVLGGSQLAAEPKSEIAWENLIAIEPLMKLLEMHKQPIDAACANPDAFKKSQDELLRYAELVALLGKASIIEKSTYADDAQFAALAKEMTLQSQAIARAVHNNDPEAARVAAGKLGQSCSNCHDAYRN
jgi:cytochrome c556